MELLVRRNRISCEHKGSYSQTPTFSGFASGIEMLDLLSWNIIFFPLKLVELEALLHHKTKVNVKH